MHREISYADRHFEQESQLSLYLLTALLGLLIGADLWPIVARWVAGWGLVLPTWSNEVYGYRLALLAAILGGARTLYGSLDSLLQGRLGADLALAIACIAAILLREPLVAAEIVFIGMLGECLESFTFERTQRAVRGIVEICPRRCWRLRDGQEERVLASDLRVGDVVVVKPGARIPADGVVLEGRSAVDVSALTGESLPQERSPGDEVLAGSLNQMGALTIEARRVAEQTVVGQVIQLTAQALQNKASLERTADRLARYFLPAVLGLALLTFLGAMFLHKSWLRAPDAPVLTLGELARLSAYPALSVLVVACPCALILATPAAVLAALGRLAGTGILIKGGVALERLASVDAFAFDKTGTLTEGRLELGEVVPLGEAGPDEVLRLAASAEQQSEHVLAQLIVHEASARGLSLDSVERFLAHPGVGVEARTPRGTVLVGNRRLMEERGALLSGEALEAIRRLDEAGQTALLVARASSDELQAAPGPEEETRISESPSQPFSLSLTPYAERPVLVGVLGVRDRVRPEAAEVIAQLRGLGIAQLAMLTGDRAAVAGVVAEPLGLAEVHAELLPQQKAELVAAWQAGGRRVAMVGDGINDAPALARADVGLALGGTGTDIAAEAGDIVFMGDPLRSLPLLVRLSRETVRIIHQNIVWFAFVVNAVGIVLTAWLWPLLLPAAWYEESPIAAVVYHQIGSLAVLLNAMRLLWFERAPSSPAYLRWRDRFQRLNDWTERWLNLDEGLHWVGHHWKAVTVGLVAVFLGIIPLTGITIIQADEVGVVRRWGRPLAEDLEPGLHWLMPWPVDTVTRVRPRRVESLPIGYRVIDPDLGAVPASRSWSSAHGGEGFRRVPDESVMITGDGSLIELQGTVQFSISSPRVYLFEVSRPEAILRSETESVLRELVAGRTFAELLTVDRGGFQRQAVARLEERVRGYDPPGLGLRLEGLALHDLHPPQEVVPAYYQVAVAMQRRNERINKAEADAIRRVALQEGKSLQLVREAEAEHYEKRRLADARRDAFLARARARGTLGLSTEIALFLDAAALLEEGQTPARAAQVYRESRRTARAQQALVSTFRLTSEVIADALGSREKMLLDTPGGLPTWLQLWLTLGEQQRPGILPREQTTPGRREPYAPERSPYTPPGAFQQP